MVPALPFHPPYSKYSPFRAMQAIWYNDLFMQYCIWFDITHGTVKRSFTPGHAAVEHITVGRSPFLEEPKASRYNVKQLTLDL